MKQEEILKAAIDKVRDKGFDFFIGDGLTHIEEHEGRVFVRVTGKPSFSVSECCNVEHIIFSHDFAKAFFPKKDEETMDLKCLGWQYHLQKMVLEEDPIEYLEQFLIFKK